MAGVITGAVISTVGGLFGANEQANAAENAANTSANASKYAADLQYKMWQEQQALQKPWYEAGTRALPQIEARTNAMPGAFSFTAQDFNKFQDPGYAFRLAEGQKALERSAAQRGGLISGSALKAAERYGQDYGSQEFSNAYKRALDAYNSQVTREQTGYNRLAGLAGIGQQTAGTLASQAGQYGANVGNLSMTSAANQGNALLAGAAGRSSAYQGIGTNLGYALSNQNNWNRLGSMFGGGSTPSPETSAAYGATGFTYGGDGTWIAPDNTW